MLVPSTSQRDFLEKASRKYHDELTPEGVEYLTGPERGLTEEAIERFRLGVVADPLPGHERYRGWLSIPYLTAYGTTSIRFRRLDGKSGDKYLSLPGDPVRIYNPQALQRGTRAICLTEGEFDCMVVEMCGMPCIGLPGAQSWQRVWTRLLEQYESIFFLQDDDDAGRSMSENIAKHLPSNFRPIVMTKPAPDKKGDVTNFFLTHGREALKDKVLGR